MDERKIELTEFKTSFSLPEVITARMRLAYRGAIVQSQESELFMVKRWQAFQRIGLIQEWQSELWPSLEADILESDDPQVANLVIAVENAIYLKMIALENIEKK